VKRIDRELRDRLARLHQLPTIRRIDELEEQNRQLRQRLRVLDQVELTAREALHWVDLYGQSRPLERQACRDLVRVVGPLLNAAYEVVQADADQREGKPTWKTYLVKWEQQGGWEQEGWN
jgi:hypothetical protein